MPEGEGEAGFGVDAEEEGSFESFEGSVEVLVSKLGVGVAFRPESVDKSGYEVSNWVSSSTIADPSKTLVIEGVSFPIMVGRSSIRTAEISAATEAGSGVEVDKETEGATEATVGADGVAGGIFKLLEDIDDDDVLIPPYTRPSLFRPLSLTFFAREQSALLSCAGNVARQRCFSFSASSFVPVTVLVLVLVLGIGRDNPPGTGRDDNPKSEEGVSPVLVRGEALTPR